MLPRAFRRRNYMLCAPGALFAAFAARDAVAQQPPAAGYSIQRIGLLGPDYRHGADGRYSASWPAHLNAAGQVIGHTGRLDSGADAWLFDGHSTTRIGLTGPDDFYINNSNQLPARNNDARLLNARGQAAGIVRRLDPFAQSGTDSWFFNGATTVLIGLMGPEYDNQIDIDHFVRTSEPVALHEAGVVYGHTVRYFGGTEMGDDVWRYDGVTTSRIGPVGPDYEAVGPDGELYRAAWITGSNSAGDVIGNSYRLQPAGLTGLDGWVCRQGVTQLLGPTGPLYELTAPEGTFRQTSVVALNNANQFIGTTTRLSSFGLFSLGNDAWLKNDESLQILGLTGDPYELSTTNGEIYHSASAGRLNAHGHVVGFNSRVGPAGGTLGRDAWLFDGVATQRIGLSGPGYEYLDASAGGSYRNSDYIGLTWLSDSGAVAGRASRFNAVGRSLGSDAWYFDGQSTTFIGPTGPGVEFTNADGLFRISTPLGINSSGQVFGTAVRFTPGGTQNGSAAWYYDHQTGATYRLEFSFRAGDNYASSGIHQLTDAGVAIGAYAVYSGANYVGQRAFWWTPAGGLHDLGELVAGGLPAQDWSGLSGAYASTGSVPSGAPAYLIGSGYHPGANLPDAYLLTARYRRGDLNCDGRIDNFDIDPFVAALVDPGTYATLYPTCDIRNADLDADGAVTNFDIEPFVDLLIH